MDSTSASGTREPGLNPARAEGFMKNIAILLCIIDLICNVCVLKNRNQATGPNLLFKIVPIALSIPVFM
jgi:hypothetical protein